MPQDWIAICTISVMTLLLVLCMAVQNDMLLPRTKRLLVLVIAVVGIVSITECASGVFDTIQDPSLVVINNIVDVISFSLTPAVAVLMALAFTSSYRKRQLLWFIPSGINALLCITSPFTGLIFDISPNNVYRRGGLYAFSGIVCLIGLAIMFTAIFRSWYKSYSKKQFPTALLLLFTIIGTSIQVIQPQIHTSWLCVSVCVIIYYAMLCENGCKQDELTSLFNRRVYDYTVKRLSLGSKGIAVIIDVDSFKLVNDNGGHAYGDFCLSKIAEMLRVAFNKIGFGYRIGGDEFCVICEKATPEKVEAALCELDRLTAEQREKDSAFPTTSYGYAAFSPETLGIEDALVVADSQMYLRKEQRHSVRI